MVYIVIKVYYSTTGCVVSNMFNFHPEIGEDEPNFNS